MFNRYNINELFAILDCEDLEELHQTFGDFKYKKLLRYKNQLFKIKHTDDLSPSLLMALDDASMPVNVLWGLPGIVGAGIAATVLSTISLGLIPIISGIYCYYAYQSQQNVISTLTNFFQLTFLKFEAANKIAEHYGKGATENAKHQFIEVVNQHILHSKKAANVSVTSSIGVTFASGLTLFGCFYLGISSMVETLGFLTMASVLSGPIGIGIALGVSLLAAIYIGYKHYQSEKNKQAIQGCQKILSNKIRQHSMACHQLKTIADIKQSSNCHGFFNKIKENTFKSSMDRNKIVQRSA